MYHNNSDPRLDSPPPPSKNICLLCITFSTLFFCSIQLGALKNTLTQDINFSRRTKIQRQQNFFSVIIYPKVKPFKMGQICLVSGNFSFNPHTCLTNIFPYSCRKHITSEALLEFKYYLLRISGNASFGRFFFSLPANHIFKSLFLRLPL